MSKIAAVLSTFAWLAACESAPKPTTPSAPVTALTITKPPASMKAGETFQVIATATLANGQSTTTGFVIRWSTSDADIAVVSPSGLVTAKADGRATISASLDAIAASAEFLVRTGGRTLTGIVTETAPTTSVGVAGARVSVSDGLYAGFSTTTDAHGAFALADVNGVLNLRVSAPNFDDAQVSADTAAPSGLTVRLLPTARTVTDSAEGRSSGTFREGTVTFDMHREGRVDLLALADSTYGSDDRYFCTTIRTSDNTLVWSKDWFIPIGTPRRPATLSLDGGKRYTVTIDSCSKEVALTAFTMTVTHPY